MKTEDLLKTIKALREASAVLRGAESSISAQVRLGGECFSAAYDLEQALIQAHPETKVEA